LVLVRLVWRKGAIYRFFWWHCEAVAEHVEALSEEKMDMAFRLDATHMLAQISTAYFPCFFCPVLSLSKYQAKENKIKKSTIYFEEPKFNLIK